MKIIYNFTPICTLFIIPFLNSQRTSKTFRSAKVLAVYFIFWPGWLAVQWRYYGITSEKRWTWVKKQFMEVKSQGSDLEKLWYLCPDPFPPSGISGLSNWFRSANEARLETVVLKMKHWYCSYQDYTDYESYLPWLFSKFVSSVWARGKERWWSCMHLPQEEEGEDPRRDEALPSSGQLYLPEKGPCEDFFLDQPRW